VPIFQTGFAIGAFLELGNLWREINNVIPEFAVRADAGFGVRYITPIGPVAFDLGFILGRYTFEPPFVFNFSIGLF
jgi:outer membrane translocation and assembly module TamA